MNEMNEFLSMILVLIVIVAMVLGLSVMFEEQCFAQTEDIGFDVRWSFLGKCQIEVESGRWIPLESYYFRQE